MAAPVAAGYFQILNASGPGSASLLGGFTAGTQDTLKLGLLCYESSDSIADVAGASNKPFGFVYSRRLLQYAPTKLTLDQGEDVTVAQGHILAAADSSFFYSGLPSVGSQLYVAAGGLMDVNGQYMIGKVIRADSVRYPPNTTKSVVVFEAEFGGKDV